MLATLVHSNHISLPMLMGTHSPAAYLQLQVVWVYIVNHQSVANVSASILSFTHTGKLTVFKSIFTLLDVYCSQKRLQ
ncbi:hypothetical protein FKN93_11580 [Vibrio sp. A8-1]|nr:hypothetical protein [Vibrio sp. A8-1]